MSGESEGGAGKDRDFTRNPVYGIALQLCGLVLDLEPKFPDDERAMLYDALKRCAIESGSLLASGFGRSSSAARLELWEQARSRVMEARHLIMVARMRYLVDEKDVERFEEAYAGLIDGIGSLIGGAAGAGFIGRSGCTGGRKG
jgi:four helix bundle protein